jgi:hypothetical protein
LCVQNMPTNNCHNRPNEACSRHWALNSEVVATTVVTSKLRDKVFICKVAGNTLAKRHYKLHATYMLNATCYTLHATRYMLQATSYTLHASYMQSNFTCLPPPAQLVKDATLSALAALALCNPTAYSR